MRHCATTVLAVLTAAVLVGDTAVERSVAAQSSRGGSLTAVPGAVGFLDPTGPSLPKARIAFITFSAVNCQCFRKREGGVEIRCRRSGRT